LFYKNSCFDLFDNGLPMSACRHANPLRYLFIDFNSFFASVEQQETPGLRGLPVAVAPVMTDSTCAIAASYEAKAFGIRTGTPLDEAKKRCPELVIVPARHELYVEYHHRLLTEVHRHVPIHKVWSVDELVCKLDRTQRSPHSAGALAKHIKKAIAEQVAPCLTSSIGIGPSSLLAKIAADLRKPDGLVILRAEDLPGPLLDLKLMDLPGVGGRMAKRLAKAHIADAGALWNMSARQARAIWGSVQGERFWYGLHGFDVPDLATERSLIGHSRVLDPGSRRPAEARLVARTLTLKAAYRLRHYDLAAGGFMLAGDKRDFGWSSHVRFGYSQDSFVFLHWLEFLWPQLVNKAGRHPRFQHVQIGLFDLIPAQSRQLDLLQPAHADGAAWRRGETVWRTLDGINRKYGRESVTLASQFGQDLKYIGAKIAFNRVPDSVEYALSGWHAFKQFKEEEEESRYFNLENHGHDHAWPASFNHPLDGSFAVKQALPVGSQ
jgi:DNA polymerase-4